MPFSLRNSIDHLFFNFLLEALYSKLCDNSVSSIASLSETPSEPDEHPLLLLNVVLALLQVDEELMRVFFFLKLVRLQIRWQFLLLSLPGQIPLEKVKHVVFRETLALELLFWPGYFQNDLWWDVTLKEVLLS